MHSNYVYWRNDGLNPYHICPTPTTRTQDYRRHGGEHMGTCLQGFELQDLTNDALRESAAGEKAICVINVSMHMHWSTRLLLHTHNKLRTRQQHRLPGD